MKTPLIVLLSTLMLTFFSCKKDDPKTTLDPENAPISKAFFVGPFTITVSGTGNWEYGCKFTVARPGKITKLGSKMPTTGTYRVTLWDADTKTVLAQSNITQPAGQAITFNPITAVAVSTGKNYLISIWSNTNWNEIRKSGGGSMGFPITSGNITITGYQWVSSATGGATAPVYPLNNETSYAAGVADFEYQADPF